MKFVVTFDKNIIPDFKGLNKKEWGRPTFLIEEEYYYYINGVQHTIPAGLITDFASIPRPFWAIFLPYDPSHAWAALIHDLIYQGHLWPKHQADLIFKAALEYSGNSNLKCNIMYQAVNLAGHFAFNNVRKEKIVSVRGYLALSNSRKYVFEA